jgi:hypothetical protein
MSVKAWSLVFSSAVLPAIVHVNLKTKLFPIQKLRMYTLSSFYFINNNQISNDTSVPSDSYIGSRIT